MDTVKNRPSRAYQVFGYPGDGVQLIRHFQNRNFTEGIETVCQVGETAMRVKTQAGEAQYYLADLGMIAYPDGGWHPYNWCERI